jgi:hypothetical protein
MGGGHSARPMFTIDYKEDRGGIYWVKEGPDERVYEWVDPQMSVSTYRSNNKLEAALLGENTVTVHVMSQALVLQHVNMIQRGYCTVTVFRCIFAAIRSYTYFFKKPVLVASVFIESNDGIAAYNCYMKAFKMNGFEAIKDPKIQEDNVRIEIKFRKIIYNKPKLVF